MSLLTRLFRFGKSEAHAALDQIEDPVRMTEQGIRELKAQLTEAMKGLAIVKAQAIRAARDRDELRETEHSYERKAMLLVQRGQSGELAEAEADRLATEALGRVRAAAGRSGEVAAEVERYDQMSAKLEHQITTLRTQIGRYENELRTLKARSQVSRATRKLNEQLARVDSAGTVAMLERMRDKVNEEEALAEAYGEIASVPTTVDDEINRALAGTEPTEADALAALKAKLAAGPAKSLPST